MNMKEQPTSTLHSDQLQAVASIRHNNYTVPYAWLLLLLLPLLQRLLLLLMLLHAHHMLHLSSAALPWLLLPCKVPRGAACRTDSLLLLLYCRRCCLYCQAPFQLCPLAADCRRAAATACVSKHASCYACCSSCKRSRCKVVLYSFSQRSWSPQLLLLFLMLLTTWLYVLLLDRCLQALHDLPCQKLLLLLQRRCKLLPHTRGSTRRVYSCCTAVSRHMLHLLWSLLGFS
jgi:hypothetical protein